MKWFIDLKLTMKLVVSFVLVAMVAGLIGYVGVVNVKKLNENDTMLYEKMTVPLGYLVTMSGSFHRERYNIAMAIHSNEMNAIEDYCERTKNYADQFSKAGKQYESTFIDDHDKQQYEKLIALNDQFNRISSDILALARQNKDAEAYELVEGKLSDATQAQNALLDEITKENVDAAKAKADLNTAQADTSVEMMLILAGVGMLLALGLGYLVSRLIGPPVKELAETAAKVAAGDLNVFVKQRSKDEVGDLSGSFNHMVARIREGQENLQKEKAGIEMKVAEAVAEIKVKEEYLSHSVDRMMAEIEKLSNGDLNVSLKVEQDDAIGQLFAGFNRSVANIRKMLLKVSEALSATASASSEISSSTEQMAAGAQEQTQQATEVAGAVEEMSKTILETTRNATLAAETAKTSGENAQEGGRVVMETMDGMVRIAEVVRQSADTVEALGRSSDQIGDIVQVIDDIADQTNLLALNAAIEAARAGEQGRGFAVVADEVRKLAERTTKATKEIAGMIKQIQKDTSYAVESMSRGTAEVEKGRALAERSSVSLNEIIGGSQKVVDVIMQVAAASEEQAKASEEITRNIEAISSVTQESAAGTQQIARAAEDLNRLTANLQELLGAFSLGDHSADMHARHSEGGRVHRIAVRGTLRRV